jgi:hypothetical protein
MCLGRVKTLHRALTQTLKDCSDDFDYITVRVHKPSAGLSPKYGCNPDWFHLVARLLENFSNDGARRALSGFHPSARKTPRIRV